jgi:hypothetical protein
MDNKCKIVVYVLLSIIIMFVVYSLFDYTSKNREQYRTNIYNNFTKSLNYINIRARNNTNFTYNEPDKNVIYWVTDLLQTYNCGVYIHDKNKIVYGHPDLEFNYSHTMSDYVILSNHDYNLLKRYYNEQNDNIIYNIGLTIVHESLHVHQRLNYEKYKELYKQWGYVFVDKIYNFNHILKTKRQNPDANDNDILWSNKGKYYFINCFFDPNNVNADVVNRYAYTIVKDNKGYYKYKGESPISLNKLSGYYEFFGDVHNDYTPNEICAEYNEKLYTECINNYDKFSSPGYNMFKNWYVNNVF